MYQGKTILCIIPARGGSKGLPGKNIKELLGKPLIAYTIEHAKKSRYIDRVIVSTEDNGIADISRRYGAEVPFTRPYALASDESSVIDVLLHAVDWLQKEQRSAYDIVILLHTTTPLREDKDIDRCIEILVSKGADNVFSVTEAHRNPYFNMVEVGENHKVHLVKEGNHVTRQSAPKVFDMNASIYVWWTDTLRSNRKVLMEKSEIYIMPKERSVDIDDYLDFKIAEMLLKEKIINV